MAIVADFSTADKFSSTRSFSQVKFGSDGKVLEVELNEMQKITAYRDLLTNKLLLADGFVNMSTMSVASGVLTVNPDTVIVGGVIHELTEAMKISVASGDNIYLALTTAEINGSSTIYKSGNLSGGTTLTNDIYDPRVGSIETTRRIQDQVQLVKTNTGSATYIPVATMTSATAFTDKRVKCFMSFQDTSHRLVTDTQINSWTNAASNYATHAADNTAHIYYGGSTGGSANAYTISTSPAPAVLADGDTVRAKIHADSTAASSLNWQGLGSFPIWDSYKNPVTSLKQNVIYAFSYEAVNKVFILQGKGGGGNVTGDQLLLGVTATSDAGPVIGTMPNNGAVAITPGTAAQTIALGYHNGQGAVAGDANLISANIKSGVSIFGIAGNSNVVDTSAGTATADQILSGQVAYVDGAAVTGTMVNQANYTNALNTYVDTSVGSTLYVRIPNGAYLTNVTSSGHPEVKVTDANFLSANIKAGVSIFGLSGKSSVVETSDATAVAAYILTGYTAYVNGAKVTGTIPNKGSATYTPTTAAQTIAASQYLSGVQTIAGDANLVSANIKSGVSIFGVAGKSSVVETSAGTATAAQILVNKVAYVNGAAVTGTMVDRTVTGNDYVSSTYPTQPISTAVAVAYGTFGVTTPTLKLAMCAPAGYYSGVQNNYVVAEASTVASTIGLTSDKIKAGSTILGIAGNSNVVDTSAGTATAAQILAGQVAYVGGAAVTGTMPNHAASSSVANQKSASYSVVADSTDGWGLSLYLCPPAGYYDGVAGQGHWVGYPEPNLISANVKAGTSIFGIAGKSSVVETSDATATAPYILTGYNAYVNGTKVAGTMTNKGAATYTPTTTDQTIAAAQYISGDQTIKGDANLISANIKSGVSIFGVAGNSNVVDTSPGTATAAQILSGAIAYVDGVQITGTIASKAAATYTPTTTAQTIAASQYLSGVQTIAGDANLVSANIKSGVSIFGVAGKSSVVETASATATAAQVLSGKTAYVNGALVTGTMVNQAAETMAADMNTLTNMITNGSFENGTTGWTGATLNTTNYKFGTASNSLLNSTTSQAVSLVEGHIYYASAWFMRSASITGTIQFDIPTSGTEMDFATLSNTTMPSASIWYMLSNVVTAPTGATGAQTFRYYNQDTAATIYADGFVLIDLTAAYGAGYEPTKAQMDALIAAIGGWFDGSVVANNIPVGAYITTGSTGGADVLTPSPTLITDNIKSGVTILGVAGKSSVVETNDATATAPYILTGYNAYVNGVKVAGTMTNKGAATYTPTTTDQTIAAAQYISGDQTIKGDANLISANIKAGVSIFGVAGNSNVVDTSPGTATAAQILSGAIAYVDGVQITGTIASKAAATYTPTTTAQTIAASQYLSGVQTISGDANLVSANIKSGVSIFGVAGKSSVVETSAGTATAAQILVGKVAYVNGAAVTGTMPNLSGNWQSTAFKGSYNNGSYCGVLAQIPQGYSDGGTNTYTLCMDSNFVPANIVNGVTIFGVTGSATPSSLGGSQRASGTGTVNGSTFTATGFSFTPKTANLFVSTSTYNFYTHFFWNNSSNMWIMNAIKWGTSSGPASWSYTSSTVSSVASYGTMLFNIYTTVSGSCYWEVYGN